MSFYRIKGTDKTFSTIEEVKGHIGRIPGKYIIEKVTEIEIEIDSTYDKAEFYKEFISRVTRTPNKFRLGDFFAGHHMTEVDRLYRLFNNMDTHPWERDDNLNCYMTTRSVLKLLEDFPINQVEIQDVTTHYQDKSYICITLNGFREWAIDWCKKHKCTASKGSMLHIVAGWNNMSIKLFKDSDRIAIDNTNHPAFIHQCLYPDYKIEDNINFWDSSVKKFLTRY